jgi:hypothetical protein
MPAIRTAQLRRVDCRRMKPTPTHVLTSAVVLAGDPNVVANAGGAATGRPRSAQDPDVNGSTKL